MKRIKRNFALPLVILTAAVMLAACGSDDTSGTPSGTSSSPSSMPGMTDGTMSSPTSAGTSPTGTPAAGPHNEADVMFSTMMIPHHAQAVDMAELALQRATRAQVKGLATAIKAAQAPEIAKMSGWLAGWGQPIPTGGHDMGGSGDGMMSAEEMAQLGKATGAAFDRMWLQMMIKHHQGAVAMAKTELSSGSNAESKQLAQAIIDGQTKEISTMQALLPTITG